SLSTVVRAVESGCDLLLVHHGLFWNGLMPMVGKRRALFKAALDGNLAIYSAHLPLDTGLCGNSMLLAQACLPAPEFTAGWQPFFDVKGTLIGCRARLAAPLAREAVAAQLDRAVGTPAGSSTVRVCPGGPSAAREVGVITGAAGSEVRRVAEAGVDTLITGEGPHWTYALAEEVGVNILYGGHYATETFAVQALAARVAERFDLPWEFIHLPTGL
ncbi:MAG: Nif3-like dinuclear metal center hexameric protein, partial [Gluconacetobacter diazotrophicus]|nr:Nif3-like dinuclear metal center hexameric protein [Gluconacetobacter diazotrophicus]